MIIFQEGSFEARSGMLPWKVECDALTDADWAWAAARVAERFWFRRVIGIPSGGMRFAEVLRGYKDLGGDCDLIVDDVLTTGRSMEEARRRSHGSISVLPYVGIVMFARTKPAAWINPIWQLWGP